MKRTNTEPIPYSANKIPNVYKYVKNRMNTESIPPRQTQTALRGSVENRPNSETYPLTRSPSPVHRFDRQYTRSKMRREVPEAMDIESVPSKTQSRFQSPQKQIKKELITVKTVVSSAHRHRSRENRPDTNSAPQKLSTQETRRTDPSVAPRPRQIEEKRSKISSLPPRNPTTAIQPNGYQFWRCFATTNLNTLTSKKECPKNDKKLQEPTMLFDKELIDIIGSTNDKRLKVLYKNPAQAEYPSVMNLVPSTVDREKETSSNSKKTRPWR